MAKPILIVRVNDLTPSEDREKARENWILCTDNEYHVIVLSSRNVDKHSQPIIEVHCAAISMQMKGDLECQL